MAWRCSREPSDRKGLTASTRLSPNVFWLASLGAAIALGLAFFVDPENAPVVCLFRRGSGLACPGCGLTRAASHLLHGDLMASLRLHPFAVLVAVEVAAVWAIVGYRVHRGLPIGLPRRSEDWALAHAVALLALWLGRLASGTGPPMKIPSPDSL